MTDRLFPLDDVPEVPLLREPRRRRGAQVMDERLDNDYPPEWSKCATCDGVGTFIEVTDLRIDVTQTDKSYVRLTHLPSGVQTRAEGESQLRAKSEALEMLRWRLRYVYPQALCSMCLGMGSVKARVRLEAGHRCVRCGHPYMPKGDAKMLGVEPSPGRWSACDEKCTHGGPLAIRVGETWVEAVRGPVPSEIGGKQRAEWDEVFAEWRILTVHHLDGDKANLRWWNLASLCQRCHLEIQAKIVMERVYPHEHSEWFVPYVCGYYAWVYLGESITREEALGRREELLALERMTAR